ncbi:hypothetical protein [Sphingobacterium sp. MYb382]|uniref:hypothetical protein n=1 Tax=Sphingobacterium sp. MYb382 TaxID=2745278 RepID=UPI0030AE5E68
MKQYIDDIKDTILSFNPNFPVADALSLAKYGIVPLEYTINLNEKISNSNSDEQKCPN